MKLQRYYSISDLELVGNFLKVKKKKEKKERYREKLPKPGTTIQNLAKNHHNKHYNYL